MKRCYLVSYDMAEDGDYEALYEAIKAYGTWARITESTWAVVTSNNAADIRDDLWGYLPEGSRIIVVRSGTESAWENPNCRNAWLQKYL